MAVGWIANGVCNIWNERINRFSSRSFSFASPIYLPSHVGLSAGAIHTDSGGFEARSAFAGFSISDALDRRSKL